MTSTSGTGHLSPLMPYARALQRKGHEVRVAAPEGAAAFLQQSGLKHAPFDAPLGSEIDAVRETWKGLASDEIAMRFAREVFAGLNPRAALPRLQETIASWQPDVVVRESVEFAGAVAAEAAGLPHARVAVHCGLVEERLIGRVADIIDLHRQGVGLEPDAGEALRAAPTFTAFPAILDGLTLLPPRIPAFRARDTHNPAADWSSRPTWFPKDWSFSDDQPLVYITFGTEAGTSARTQAAYRAALEAVADIPVRGLLTTGPNMELANLGSIPPNVAVQKYVPQAEVFAHARAVVCHGGSGTLLGAAAVALPMVIIPLFADQPMNALHLEAAGAGIAISTPEPGLIRDAIKRALSDTALLEGVHRVAEEIGKMASVDDATDVLLGKAVGQAGSPPTDSPSFAIRRDW